MSDLDLYADLSTGKLTSRDGGAPLLPPLVLGDTVRCTLRTLDHIAGGDLRERNLRVRTLTATLGKVIEPPTSGQFSLAVNGVVGGLIDFNATDEVFTAAFAAAPPAEVVLDTPACWLARWAAPVVVTVVANTLRPTSFVRVRASEQNGQTWHEIRLIQAPLAWNENGHERVLAPPPSVSRVRTGRAATEGNPAQNELQNIFYPPAFRGTYFLRWNYRSTRIMGIEDGPDEIAAALNGMFSDSATQTRFAVANVEPDHEYVEFLGPLAAQPQPLITVEVNTFLPGVLTFLIPLDRADMAAALRAKTEIEVPLEIELEIVDDDADAADPTVPGRVITVVQQLFKIVREQKWKELAVVPYIDWLRPPTPRDYVPFTPDQIIVGQANYSAVIGDGEAAEWSLAYNLGTRNIASITVQQNATPGRVLGHGTEYVAIFASANEVVLHFAVPPAEDSLTVVIATAGPISAFLAHTHTMAQVVGLLDALSGVNGRLDAIEDLLPSSTFARRETSSEPIDIKIPERFLFFPNARLAPDFNPASVDDPKTVLPRPPALLPAIHTASLGQTTTLPASVADSAGQVFEYTGTTPLLIPGGLGRRGRSVPTGGYFGSDGRVFYALDRVVGSNSYFPADFDRELFSPLPIVAEMWQPGGTFSLAFDLDARTVQADTSAQYLVVVEVGTPAQQAAPSPVAVNLSDIAWRPTPLLAQRIVLTGAQMKHHFGAIIRRSLTGDTFTAERLLYKAWMAAPAVSEPATATFVIRARLIQFDTENSVAGATGYIYAALTEATASIT